MSSGTITLRRPRVRGVEERFESRVLPLFARRTKELGALLPELYLHGLAEGDFELAMRGLLGEGAPLSKSSIAMCMVLALRLGPRTAYPTAHEHPTTPCIQLGPPLDLPRFSGHVSV